MSPIEPRVAVAVTVWPAGTLFSGMEANATLPFALVVPLLLAPMYFLPSLPEGLEKNRILKILLERLLSAPSTVVSPPVPIGRSLGL